MKKISYLIISLFLLINIVACNGYKPVFSSSNLKFKIADHSIKGNKRLGNQLYSKLYSLSQSYENAANLKNVFISINVSKNKNATAKDTTGKILSVKKVDKSYIFDFEINSKERKNIIEKASICINGISLTISKKTKKGFQIWVIPHTFKLTNLSEVIKGSLVNIEIDILSKYVKNFFNAKK